MRSRISNLNNGIMPIYEPGLEQVVTLNKKAGRLTFTTDYNLALDQAEFAFIAVGTPSGVDGEADLQFVRSAAEAIADIVNQPIVVVNKSTVPVGTGDWVADIIKKRRTTIGTPLEFSVVSNPEFLREGSALNDFMEPDRVVLGSTDRDAANKSRPALQHAALSDFSNRPAHRGNDQICLQRFPGHTHFFY